MEDQVDWKNERQEIEVKISGGGNRLAFGKYIIKSGYFRSFLVWTLTPCGDVPDFIEDALDSTMNSKNPLFRKKLGKKPDS